MKRLIVALGVIGFVGCFLPMTYDYDGPETWSWWQLREYEPLKVYAVLAAYALPALIALTNQRISRGVAALCALAFAVAAWALWPPIPIFVMGGWWLMVLAAYGGCIVSVIAVFDG